MNGLLYRAHRKLIRQGSGAALCAIRSKARSWWRTGNWLRGKWVEIRGNYVNLRGIELHCDNQRISTPLKSLFASGAYEEEEADAIALFLETDLPVIEIGACIGFISCFTNKLLRLPSQHVVVEANSELIPTLEKNRQANQCEFQIENAALWYDGPLAEFVVHDNFYSSSVKRSGRPVRVPAVTLHGLVEHSKFQMLNLICDIEGSEIDLIHRELDVVRRHVRTMIIEIHNYIVGEEAAAQAIERIRCAGFVELHHHLCQYVFRNQNLH